MESISEHRNCFLIDIKSRQVFCRSCRDLCRMLSQPDAIRYWCANHACDNSGEVVLSPDGAWSIYAVVESSFEGLCSSYSSQLLVSHKASSRLTEPDTSRRGD